MLFPVRVDPSPLESQPRRPTLSQKPSIDLATHHPARIESFIGCPGCPQRKARTGQFLSPPPQPCCLDGPPWGLEQGHPAASTSPPAQEALGWVEESAGVPAPCVGGEGPSAGLPLSLFWIRAHWSPGNPTQPPCRQACGLVGGTPSSQLWTWQSAYLLLVLEKVTEPSRWAGDLVLPEPPRARISHKRGRKARVRDKEHGPGVTGPWDPPVLRMGPDWTCLLKFSLQAAQCLQVPT